MALMPWQAGRKPASKPVSSSRLGNQNRGQPVTNSQLGVKLLTNQRFPFFAPTLSLYIFFPASVGRSLLTTSNLGLHNAQ